MGTRAMHIHCCQEPERHLNSRENETCLFFNHGGMGKRDTSECTAGEHLPGCVRKLLLADSSIRVLSVQHAADADAPRENEKGSHACCVCTWVVVTKMVCSLILAR